MTYKVNENIVYRMIAGEHFLIAVGDALGDCPAIRQINEAGAFYWNLLAEGQDTEELLSSAAAASGIDRETLRPGLEAFLQELEKKHYIEIPDRDPE